VLGGPWCSSRSSSTPTAAASSAGGSRATCARPWSSTRCGWRSASAARAPTSRSWHSDRGSQYTSFDHTQTLADHGVLASVGSVGDAYDNALAESFVDSFKTELISDRVWQTRSQLELAVVEDIGWFNHTRLHQALGDIPPAEMEALYAPRCEINISLEMKRGSHLTRSP
jgi:transposase InsO family protein